MKAPSIKRGFRGVQMAGLGIEVVDNWNAVDNRLRRLVSNLGPDGKRQFLKGAAQQVMTETRQHFKTKSENGEAWPQLKLATVLQRVRLGYAPNNILIREGVRGGLLGSISQRIEPDQAIVGSNKIYARIHNLGGWAGRGRKVNIPARPYLKVRESTRKEFRILLEKVVSGGGAKPK